jgi:glycosyltransferase involved in cell wall biosynthesis
MYSVVIPSLGRLDYLNELLESIEKQTMEPQEILLLLDKNDHCQTISTQIKHLPNLSVLFCSGMNLAEKRNHGAAIARADILVFSDDDDLWAPTRGAAVVNALAEFGACCHNFGKFGTETGIGLSRLGVRDRTIGMADVIKGANIFGGGSSIAVRRAVVQVLPFSSQFRYCEDFEWWIRVLLASVKVRYLGDSLVCYRTHATNMTGSGWSIVYFNFKIVGKLLIQAILTCVVAGAIFARSVFRFFGLGIEKLRW